MYRGTLCIVQTFMSALKTNQIKIRVLRHRANMATSGAAWPAWGPGQCGKRKKKRPGSLLLTESSLDSRQRRVGVVYKVSRVETLINEEGGGGEEVPRWPSKGDRFGTLAEGRPTLHFTTRKQSGSQEVLLQENTSNRSCNDSCSWLPVLAIMLDILTSFWAATAKIGPLSTSE